MAPQADGASLREHLESVYNQTGVLPQQLEPVEIDDELLYIWGYFLSMNKRRTSNGFGENPITSAEMQAWSVLTHTPLSGFEVEALMQIELAYLRRGADGN